MPERIVCDWSGPRVRVHVDYLREHSINTAKCPDLTNNLLGYEPNMTWFYFRDLPEVWAALGVEA